MSLGLHLLGLESVSSLAFYVDEDALTVLGNLDSVVIEDFFE
jgi:hypothetical protein